MASSLAKVCSLIGTTVFDRNVVMASSKAAHNRKNSLLFTNEINDRSCQHLTHWRVVCLEARSRYVASPRRNVFICVNQLRFRPFKRQISRQATIWRYILRPFTGFFSIFSLVRPSGLVCKLKINESYSCASCLQVMIVKYFFLPCFIVSPQCGWLIEGRSYFSQPSSFHFILQHKHEQNHSEGTNWIEHESVETRFTRRISFLLFNWRSFSRPFRYVLLSFRAMSTEKLLIDSFYENYLLQLETKNNSISLIKTISPSVWQREV